MATASEALDFEPTRTTGMHHPDSMTIRCAADIRMQLMGGRTFVMQVAHPAVGAGVHQFSAFRSDPWTRLEQIAKSGTQYLYRGEAAAYEEGRRLRRVHKNIQGVDLDGKPYHSLDPKAYGWVHTVFYDSLVSMHDLFGTPLTRDEQERLFTEWREGGRVFGLRDEDMPASVDEYWEFYDDALANTCVYSPPIDHILRMKKNPPPKPPNLERLPDAGWRALWRPLGTFQHWIILATLPPRYREKIAAHHPWTPRHQRRFERFARVVRSLHPRLPAKWQIEPEARRFFAEHAHAV
jgi:uncharacterized protein (DUF2236 family)